MIKLNVVEGLQGQQISARSGGLLSSQLVERLQPLKLLATEIHINTSDRLDLDQENHTLEQVC
jgi:hypothetical protein